MRRKAVTAGDQIERAAPTSLICGARSKTWAVMPARRSATAAAKPPMPPPIIRTDMIGSFENSFTHGSGSSQPARFALACMEQAWERGHPALVEGETPSLPACSLRASATAPAAKTPMEQPGKEGFQPSTRTGCPRSQAHPGVSRVPMPTAKIPRMKNYDLSGKVALVTGAGRPRGLGEGIAKRLAECGCSVLVTDLGASPGEHMPDRHIGATDSMNAVVQGIRDQGGEAEAWPLDVREESQVRSSGGPRRRTLRPPRHSDQQRRDRLPDRRLHRIAGGASGMRSWM